jgi:glycosyltransferase involved in cell wall biosynthesis
MRLLYDGRVFQFQRAGGINRYFAEIISGLPADWEPVVTGVIDFGANVPRHVRLSTPVGPKFWPGRLSRQVCERWWRPNLVGSVDLLHPTYYDLSSGLDLAAFRCPVVTTVHDMIYARYADQICGSETIVTAQREAVLRADRIVCVSKATEEDLLRFIPEASGKTEVVYHGSSFPVSDDSQAETIFEQPTFLFVGGRAGYKNFLFLLRAFAKACQSLPKLRLYVAGSALIDEERWQMHFLGISDRVTVFVHPDEATLQELYRKSVALLYPSRHEGFGIPPLEAMACRTIPITANTTSLPEVMGDAGIMLDPTNEEAWVDAILSCARGALDRSTLLAKGIERSKQFSWRRTVDEHIALYRSLAR